MNKRLTNVFPQYHPAVCFSYIAAAIFCAMYTFRPVFVIISFICGSAYSVYLNGVKAYIKALRPLFFMFLIIAIINPLTNHRGMHTLFFLFGRESMPVTYEALIFGICSGAMLVCVFIWFQCYQSLISNDKFLFLFGRFAPTTSMVISMIIKLIPVTIKKYHEIAEAQKMLSGISRDDELAKQGRMHNIRTAIKATGMLLTRSFEDSIDSADSMNARGYGSGKRTRFNSYKLCRGDVLSLIFIALLAILSVTGISLSNAHFEFFPLVRLKGESPTDTFCFFIYALLLLFPLLTELKNTASLKLRYR